MRVVAEVVFMDSVLVMIMATVVGVLVVAVVVEAFISAAAEALQAPPPESTSITVPARRHPPSHSN